MNQENNSFNLDPEFSGIVNRYMQMLQNGTRSYFDIHEYEFLIEHFLQQGDLNQASQVTDHAIQQNPGSHNLMIKKSQVLIDKGCCAEALDLLSQIEMYETCNPELFLLKGIASNFLGKHADARLYFAQALYLADETRLDTLFSIAINYSNLNNFETAINYLLEAHNLEKNNLTILFELGFNCDKLDDFEGSIKYYNLYLDIDPFSDTVWFNLGITYSRKGDFEKAIDAFEFAIALNERYVLAYFNKGNAQVNIGKFNDAIKSYSEYLEYEPDHTETLCFIGECYERLNQTERALDYYYRVLAIDTSYADAIYGVGIVHSILNNNEESLVWLKRAIELNATNSDYWFSIGSVYSKLKIHDSAIEAFNNAIGLDPHDYESWLNLSEIYYNKKLLSKAIKTLEDAYNYNSTIPQINFRLAAYNLLRQNISEGLLYFRRGIKGNFEEHNEIFKFCPEANQISEINELIKQYNSIKS